MSYQSGWLYAERREVEPVRDHAEIGEQSLAAGREHRHVAAGARDVDLGAEAVIGGEYVQRHVAALVQRPLVDFGQRADRANLVRGNVQELRGDNLCLILADLIEHFTGVGEYGRLIAEAVGRPVHNTDEDDAPAAPSRGRVESGLFGGFGERQLNARDVDLVDTLEARFRGHGRHSARVHHHDARAEPHDHQETDRDAEIAMRQDQGLAEEPHSRSSGGCWHCTGSLLS